MAATAPLTFGEFIQLPEPDTGRIELLLGKLLTMRRGEIPHDVVKKNLSRILTLWLAQYQIADVFVESMYQLGE